LKQAENDLKKCSVRLCIPNFTHKDIQIQIFRGTKSDRKTFPHVQPDLITGLSGDFWTRYPTSGSLLNVHIGRYRSPNRLCPETLPKEMDSPDLLIVPDNLILAPLPCSEGCLQSAMNPVFFRAVLNAFSFYNNEVAERSRAMRRREGGNRTLHASLYMKDPENLPVYVERKIHRADDLPPVHDHEFYELVFVVHGHASHVYENKYYPLHGGDLLLIRPGQFHTYLLERGTSFELINCLFLPSLFDREWRAAIDPQDHIEAFLLHPFLKRPDEFHPCLPLERADARQIEARLADMLEEQKNLKAYSATIIRLKLFELLLLLIRLQDEALQQVKLEQTKPHHLRSIIIRQIHQFLAENAEQKHCINQLSELLGISPRHINRLFKQDTGKTVIEMLHYARIERAKHLLMHTNDRIMDIAAKVGYEDTSFFTKLFIRKMKCSPGQYRENMQIK